MHVCLPLSQFAHVGFSPGHLILRCRQAEHAAVVLTLGSVGVPPACADPPSLAVFCLEGPAPGVDVESIGSSGKVEGDIAYYALQQLRGRCR